jgi:hypothetical protein
MKNAYVPYKSDVILHMSSKVLKQNLHCEGHGKLSSDYVQQ